MYKVVRLTSDRKAYRPIFIMSDLRYLPNVLYTQDPMVQGAFAAFRTYRQAFEFALNFVEFAIFACVGELADKKKFKWKDKTGCILTNVNTAGLVPEGTIFLKSFKLTERCCERKDAWLFKDPLHNELTHEQMRFNPNTEGVSP